MENKSSKYYLLGGVVLVVIIVIILSLGKNSKTGQKTQTENTANAPISNTVTPSTSDLNSTSSNSLIGTWVSSVPGKGLQATGKFTAQNATTQITINGDVNLVIQKVENNIASGMITYNNLCLTSIVSVPGKTDVTTPPRCINNDSKPVTLQINNDKLSFEGQTAIGANVSFTGSYTSSTASGTFTWTGSYGKIDGTFNLVHAKN